MSSQAKELLDVLAEVLAFKGTRLDTWKIFCGWQVLSPNTLRNSSSRHRRLHLYSKVWYQIGTEMCGLKKY